MEEALIQIVSQKSEILLSVIDKEKKYCFILKMILTASIVWMPFFAISQDIHIRGVIKDSKGQVLPNTIIIASSTINESDIIAFYSSGDCVTD